MIHELVVAPTLAPTTARAEDAAFHNELLREWREMQETQDRLADVRPSGPLRVEG